MPTKIVIYEALLSFLTQACRANNTSLSGKEVATLQKTLNGYLVSMASNNVVSAIVESLGCRKLLLEVSLKFGLANNQDFRIALHTDDERIAKHLVSIFKSKSAKDAVLRLEGDSAQYFLDVVQDTLDRGFIMTPEHTRMAHRIVRKLSESCDRLPSALFITGVSGCDDHPTFGGGYGDIFHASHNGRPVALKRMRYFLRGSDLRRIRLKFCREALVWKDLHHPHILPFMGIDRDSFPSSLCMVSPWMEHGTIINYMNQHGHANVDKLLYEIAQGLQYLHSQNIVHGDLRGTNILITEDWRACLTDFGLSVFSDATSSMTTNRGGSLYWMAPELLDPDKYGLKFVRTTATDVYAYGCVCLEVYTGRPPFAHLPEPAALMKILQGERPQRPSGSPAMTDILWRNISTYWADSPTARPDTQLVVHNMVWATPEWPLRSFDPASPPLANKFDQPRSPGPSPAAATSTVTAGNDPASRPVKSPSKWLNRISNPLINILPSRFFPVDAKSPPPDGQLPTLGENEYEVLYDCYEAVYDYSAVPDDPNEIYFQKGELVSVIERQGVWWQVRKADGSLGVVPSNCLQTSLNSSDKGEIVTVIEKQGEWWLVRKADGSSARVPSNCFRDPVDSSTMEAPSAVISGSPTSTLVGHEPGASTEDLPILQYKAIALYDYQAASHDGNEMSFSKNEILDIVEKQGHWWQAKRADGSIRIVPSNYLEIILQRALRPGGTTTLDGTEMVRHRQLMI